MVCPLTKVAPSSYLASTASGGWSSRLPALDQKTIHDMIFLMCPHRLGRILALIECSVVLLCAACSQPPATPEEEIRQLVANIEEATRQKDIVTLKAQVSERYRDEEQRDKQALKALLAYYFLQHRSIYVLTRLDALSFPQPGTAEITLFAAMAASQIPDASWLPRLRADIYRFETRWEKEGDGVWRLLEATWHPASTADFG
jgi:hypothetical protein